MFSSDVFRPPPKPFPLKHDPGVRRWALKTPRPNLEKYIIHSSWLVSEILRIPAAAFTSIFFELMVEPPRLKNYTQVKIYHQPPSWYSYTPCYTHTHTRSLTYRPGSDGLEDQLLPFLSTSATLQGSNFEVNRSMHHPKSSLWFLMCWCWKYLKSWKAFLRGFLQGSSYLMREFIEIYHTVYLYCLIPPKN